MSDIKLNTYRFETENGNSYLYDNVSGMVYPCNDAMNYTVSNFYILKEKEIIEHLGKKYNMKDNRASALYRYVKILINSGSFYKRKSKMLHKDLTPDDLLKTSLSQLILVVTEDCNMRCKYCMYSDNYPHVKSYTTKKMSFEVAKKAVDYYMEIHKKRVANGFKRNPVISFFGGEPLLEFLLMKQVIEYCKEKEYSPVIFATTNATLLNDEIIDFVIENNIILTISLDGSKLNNDRNRVFPNGDGTFDIIMRNIKKLQNEKKRRNKVQALSFSCCYDSYSDMCSIVKFFDDNHDLFYPYNVLYNQVSPYDTLYYDYCDKAYEEGTIEGDKNNLENSIKILKKQFLNSVTHNEQVKSVGLTYIFFSLLNIIWRTKGQILNPNNHTCIPGSKISVGPDGNYFVCERVSQMCSIGDVENNLDIAKINELSNKLFSILYEHCKDCPFSRLCSMCYMHLVKENDLEFNYEMCRNSKKAIPRALETVFSVLEKNPDAFQVLQPNENNREFYEITR